MLLLSFSPEVLYQIVIFILILFSAFFSGAETALVSANLVLLEVENQRKNKKIKHVLYILKNIEDAITMVLIGNNIVNVAATTFITYVVTKIIFFSSSNLFLINIVVTMIQTIIFLIVCEVTPKIVARSKPESYLIFFAFPIRFLMLVFLPFIKLILSFSNILKKIFNINKDNVFSISRDEIDVLFEIGSKDGIIDEDNRVYVSEILSFKGMSVHDVMTPTIDIQAVELNESVKNLVNKIEETKFSRIPIYEERVDNIIGYVFFKDLLLNKNVTNIKNIMTKTTYIPATKNIYDLFVDMQSKNIPLYFVVNEYGGVIGMVTHEDIAEEVVGEIQTRDHEDEKLIETISQNEFKIKADIDLDYFIRKFPMKIEKKNFDTLGGFITYKLGYIPKVGTKFTNNEFTFLIEEATDRSIEYVILSGKNGEKITY